MVKRIGSLLSRLTWAQRFMLASVVILVLGMVGIGWWVGMQIESGVIHQSAAYSALYVTSIIEPDVQELATSDSLSPEYQTKIARLLQETSLGQNITAVKIWNNQGRIVYATDAENIGQTYAIDDDLARALRGWVAAGIDTLDKSENIHDRDRGSRRLSTYSPVRRAGTSQIIGAVEFYQTVAGLDSNIATAQQRSWLIVGAATLMMLLVMGGFVRGISRTIQRQQNELSAQVGQLKELLEQNQELHERVRRAARRTTALNERFLRRISAELHDGPLQDLGLALLRLDHLLPQAEPGAYSFSTDSTGAGDFQTVSTSVRHALQEIRAISTGMGLPELENVTLGETVLRAIRAHERRTGTSVNLTMEGLPDSAPLSVKITVYRIIQEGLSNAYRHAGGASQQVEARGDGDQLRVVISDGGPGFDQAHRKEWDDHLGLAGMRERVESLGGVFHIESELGRGTRVIAELPTDVS